MGEIEWSSVFKGDSIYDTAQISAQRTPIDVKPTALCGYSYNPQQSNWKTNLSM